MCDKHLQCAVIADKRRNRLPAGALKAGPRNAFKSRPWLLVGLLGAFIVIGAISAQTWLTQMRFLPALLPFPQTTQPLPATALNAQTGSPEPSSTNRNATLEPTALITKSIPISGQTQPSANLPPETRVPMGLETPIGTNPVLLIHRVLPGESLDMIAARYKTSVEAIQAINYDLPSPLWVALPLVIPLEEEDVASLPQFEPYQVETTGTTARLFAESMKVDLAKFCQYNLVHEDTMLIPGQWLLLPRGTG